MTDAGRGLCQGKGGDSMTSNNGGSTIPQSVISKGN